MTGTKGVLVILPFFRYPQAFLELGIGMRNTSLHTNNKLNHFQFEKFRDQHKRLLARYTRQVAEVGKRGYQVASPTDESTAYGKETEAMRVEYINTRRDPPVPWTTSLVDVAPGAMPYADDCSMKKIQDAYARTHMLLQWGYFYWKNVSEY